MIVKAFLDARAAVDDRPPLAILQLTLATLDGAQLPKRASVVVPMPPYDDPATRARYAAVASDIDPSELARGNSVLARHLVGRELNVALREGRVVWIRSAEK